MSENTKIEWCDHSWSPWEGCTKVSPGCAHCYAESMNHRWGKDNWGRGKPRRITVDWTKPLRWNSKWDHDKMLQEAMGPELPIRRPRIFPSIMDWLDDEVPIEWLARFLKLIHDTPHLDWLLLTKRPENWLHRMALVQSLHPSGDWSQHWLDNWFSGDAPENVWIGTSVEDQANADRRIPELLKIPARVRFLSVEPMLGPVEFNRWDLTGESRNQNKDLMPRGSRSRFDWIIIGGESGPGARLCNVDWIRNVVRQCESARVPCFVKQLGRSPFMELNPPDNAYTQKWPLILDHPKGGDPSEWPEDLRVRQFPEVKP